MKAHLSIKTWRARSLAGLVAAALAAAGVQGCGTVQRLSTEDSLGHDASALIDQPSLQLTISLGTTESQLVSESHGRLKAAAAAAIVQSSIVVDVDASHGKNLNQATGVGNGSLQLRSGHDTVVEIRVVDGVLYARATLADVHKDYGVSESELGRISAGADAAAKEVPGLATLVSGGWVKVPGSDLKAIERLGGASATPAKVTADKGMISDLRASMVKAFSHSTRITDNGPSGGLTAYTLTTDVRPLLHTLVTSPGFKQLAALAPTSALVRDVDSVPSTKAVVHLYTAGGVVKKLTVDLNQFRRPRSAPLPLVIAFSPGTQVSAPSGAVTLDVQRLLAGLIDISSVSSSSSSGIARSTAQR